MADHMFLDHPPDYGRKEIYWIPDPEHDLDIFKEPLQIVSRAEWGAAEPYTLDLCGHPLPHLFVLLMYTRTRVCRGDLNCARLLREIQRDHMEKRHLPDIQWKWVLSFVTLHGDSFMIGGNGRVYEGRGWTLAATKDSENMPWNYKSIDIAYVGEKEEDVTKQMEIAASRLIRLGRELKIIREHFSVLPDMIYRPEDYPPVKGNESLYHHP